MIRKDQTRTNPTSEKNNKKKNENENENDTNSMEKWYHVVSKENGEYFFGFPLSSLAFAPAVFLFLFNIQFTWNRWIEYYYKVVKACFIFCVLYFDADRRYACLCDGFVHRRNAVAVLLCQRARVPLNVCVCVCLSLSACVSYEYTTVEIPSYFLHHIAHFSHLLHHAKGW